MSGEARRPRPVLVVDDERDIREALQDLIGCAGYEVHTAANGRDALGVLSTIPTPGLILLDLMMPVMNGREFIAHVQGVPSYRDIPIVVLTSAPVTLRGVMALLRKPPDLDDLLAHVTHLCGDPARGGGPTDPGTRP